MGDFPLKYHRLSENCLEIQWPQEINPAIIKSISSLEQAIQKELHQYVMELLPTYAALAIFYDTSSIRFDAFEEKVKSLKPNSASLDKNARLIEIPVCYHHDFGPDQQRIADHHGIDVDTVIKLHHQNDYLVYMTGFLPGFVYLGVLNSQIQMPRLSSPRTRVPAGSVGIANAQTGIYGLSSPGGWNIIGQTPKAIVNLTSDEPSIFKQGDRVKFVPISIDEYHKMAEE